jgi:hypothetical protein
MPNRANPLVPAFFVASLAGAVTLGSNWAASAAGECVDKPNLEINQAGHWYYYVDRVHHQRCWFFETSGPAISPPSPPDQELAPNADQQPSWLSRFAARVAQALYSEPQQSMALQYAPQQNSALDNSATVTRTVSPRHPRTNKIARRERSQIAPRPETNGVASAERHDQLLPQSVAEKEEKLAAQLTAADRETLFKDFLKWYIDRNIFGRP